jgi:hypothetical protein
MRTTLLPHSTALRAQHAEQHTADPLGRPLPILSQTRFHPTDPHLLRGAGAAALCLPATVVFAPPAPQRHQRRATLRARFRCRQVLVQAIQKGQRSLIRQLPSHLGPRRRLQLRRRLTPFLFRPRPVVQLPVGAKHGLPRAAGRLGLMGDVAVFATPGSSSIADPGEHR